MVKAFTLAMNSKCPQPGFDLKNQFLVVIFNETPVACRAFGGVPGVLKDGDTNYLS